MFKIENATIWPQLIFLKSLTHSFALLVWDQDALNAKMASVCIALKCLADSSADWLGNSVTFLNPISDKYLFTGPTPNRNIRVKENWKVTPDLNVASSAWIPF